MTVASQSSQLGIVLDPVVMEESTRARQATTLHDQSLFIVSHCTNDNYCLIAPVCAWQLTRINETLKSCQYPETVLFCRETLKYLQTEQTLNVYSIVVNHAHSVTGRLPQKKDVCSDIVLQKLLKYVEYVSGDSVDQLSLSRMSQMSQL